jgi:hypothetical protein
VVLVVVLRGPVFLMREIPQEATATAQQTVTQPMDRFAVVQAEVVVQVLL